MTRSRDQRWDLWLWPAFALAVHLLTWRGYGWFRDELYYVVCARHLAWGYVDHPPFSIALLRAVMNVTGTSLFAMRAVAALCSAAAVLSTGALAGELGGNRAARVVAMTAALAAPLNLAIGFFYSMNVIDLVVWPLAMLLVLRAARRERRADWAIAGLVLGIGLLNKISVLWLGGGLAVGLLMTPARRTLRTPGPWVAGAVAGLIFAPHVLWQIRHDWPTLEFIRHAGGEKMQSRSVLTFTRDALGDEGIVVALLGLSGLATAWWRQVDARARVVAWAWVAVFALLAMNKTSRTEYLAPAWCWLFALAGVAIERFSEGRSATWRVAPVGVTAAFGAVALPLALPVLTTDTYVRVAARLGATASTEEKNEVGRLPQFFADMNGWESIVGSLEAAWRQLPADRQPHAVIFGTNYGESAAVDVLGGARGMPAASGSHNNYFLWGPPDESVDAVVVMSSNPARWRAAFEHTTLAGETDCGDCMPYENHRPIYIAWGRKVPWRDAWPGLKHFD
ncbi:MAG: glycosyltransferase family 39 protein [Vicinamibacterales bacterium]